MKFDLSKEELQAIDDMICETLMDVFEEGSGTDECTQVRDLALKLGLKQTLEVYRENCPHPGNFNGRPEGMVCLDCGKVV